MAETKTVAAGFDAEALDPSITLAIDRLHKVIADVERIRGTAEPILDRVRQRVETLLAESDHAKTAPELVVTLSSLVEMLERYARVGLNFAKITDETARLRSFVAGGADSRPDLGHMSDAELAAFIRRNAGQVPSK